MVMGFENSAGRAVCEAGAFLANHIHLRPGREQAVLDNSEDDEGKLFHTTFRMNYVLFDAQILHRRWPSS